LGTTIKYPRRTANGAAGNGLGATMKYLRRTSSGAVPGIADVPIHHQD
jgi:hypothetical protein